VLGQRGLVAGCLVVTEGLYFDWPGGLEYVTVPFADLHPTTLLTMPQGVVHTFVTV